MANRPLIVTVLGGLRSCGGTLVAIPALVPVFTGEHAGAFYVGGILNWFWALLGATVVSSAGSSSEADATPGS